MGQDTSKEGGPKETELEPLPHHQPEETKLNAGLVSEQPSTSMSARRTRQQLQDDPQGTKAMLKELKELRLENQETKAMLKELKELRLENDYLKSLLKKEKFVYNGITFELKRLPKLKTSTTTAATTTVIDDEVRAEKIQQEFHKYFQKVQRLPKQLEIDKVRLWPICCNIFKISFQCCREDFINKLVQPLYFLTELSKKEIETSETDWDRADELKDVKIAYDYLLKYSKSRMKVVNQSLLVENVMAAISNTDVNILSQLNDRGLIIEAIIICWKMQMLCNPMFVCQPKIYNEGWHDVYSTVWQERHDELIYYRPVLMNSAGGSLSYKGHVGNSSTANGAAPSTKVALCFECQDSISDPTSCIKIRGKYYHEKCINYHICAGCQKPVWRTQIVEVNEAVWHGHCLRLKCAKCGKSITSKELESKTYIQSSGDYYHQQCYYCHICYRSAERIKCGKFIYCRECFGACSYCGANTKNGHVGPKSGLVYCRRCYEYKQNQQCLKCKERVTNEPNKKFRSHDDTLFHVWCVRCALCPKKLYPEDQPVARKFEYYHKSCYDEHY